MNNYINALQYSPTLKKKKIKKKKKINKKKKKTTQLFPHFELTSRYKKKIDHGLKTAELDDVYVLTVF